MESQSELHPKDIIAHCSICDLDGKFKCGNCKVANYCSKEHQKSHWKVHKKNCFPVTFGWSPIRGNELVATRDIAQGEVVLKEMPIMCGPSGKATDVTNPICLGCNTVLGEKVFKCTKCSWPLCSSSCEKESLHAELECPIFQHRQVPPFKHHQQFESIFILRCLLLKILNPNKWEVFKRFESHMEERECNLMESLLNHAAIEFVRNTCNLSSSIEENEVKYVSGVINTNAMGLGVSNEYPIPGPAKVRKCGSYLYSLGCMICHDCAPNTYRVIQSNGELNVRAIVPIKAGEPVLTTYTDLSLSTEERRTILSNFYYFTCNCRRCSDPTELGTFFSGVKCGSVQCKNGYLQLPMQSCNSMDKDKDLNWVCNSPSCSAIKESNWISKVVNQVKEELERIPKGYSEICIEQLEAYLRKHKGISLHPNHALIYRAEYDIIQRTDYMISASLIKDPITRIRLANREVELVKDALELTGTFWKGYSSYRGRLLYFQQNARFRLLLSKVAQNMREKKRSEAGKLAIRKELDEVLVIRKEAAKILLFDPPGRDEHSIGEKVASAETPEFQIVLKYLNS